MSDYLSEFKEKCEKVSNRFNVSETESACFVVNYSDNADICRDCARKNNCFMINKTIKE